MTLVHAIFGIENGTLNTVSQLVLLAVVVVWLSLVWYTFADAQRRLDDQLLIGSAVLASLIFPFLGTIVYMIVRPPEYLEDVRERELEMDAARARLASADYQLCPHCDAPAGRDFLRCPLCLRKLRDTCGGCSRPLDPDWMICPYCEAEIQGVTPQRRRRRRGAGEDQTSQAPPGYDEPDTVSEQSHGGYDESPAGTYGERSDAHGDDTFIAQTPAEGADVSWVDGGESASGEPPRQY